LDFILQSRISLNCTQVQIHIEKRKICFIATLKTASFDRSLPFFAFYLFTPYSKLIDQLTGKGE